MNSVLLLSVYVQYDPKVNSRHFYKLTYLQNSLIMFIIMIFLSRAESADSLVVTETLQQLLRVLCMACDKENILSLSVTIPWQIT